MDFGQAALLLGFTLVVTDWLKTVIPANVPSWATPPIAMGVGIGSVFLVAETVWANENIIQGHSLESMDGASKLVAGILLGTGAGFADKLLNAVRNIGENTTPRSPTQ